MSQIHGIACNTLCGRTITWATERGDRAPTKAMMEQEARNRGWLAPDRLGRHFCPEHRPTGRQGLKGNRT